MPGPQPKGRGAPQSPPAKKVPRKGGPGVLKDTKCTILIIAAPKGSTKMLRVLMRGYATHGLSATEDGSTYSFSLERRKARDVLFKIRKLWNSEQVKVTFAQNGTDVTSAVEAEAPPQPVQNEAQSNRTQAMLQKARAVREEAAGLPPTAPAKTPGQAPDQQSWGWKDSARDTPPPTPSAETVRLAGLDYNVAEGVNGVWPYGNGYRPVDADKLDAESRKRVQFRDGKQKISLGTNSERKYMIEPDRARGGWTATRLTEEFGARDFLGNAGAYRDAIAFVQAFEEKRAGIHEAPPPAAAKSTPPAPAPTAPAPSSAPPAAPAADLTTPPAGFAMGILRVGPKSRWLVEHNGKTLAYGDNLEGVLRAARASAGNPPMLVLGWDGQVAAAPAPPSTIEIEVNGQGAQLFSPEERARLMNVLKQQRGGPAGSDEEEDLDGEDLDDDLDDEGAIDDSDVAGGVDDAGDSVGGTPGPAPQNQVGEG